uniref:Junctional cadherin 5 associated a n=1 Tax=Sinocyclocheilus rhinocerous TaxID=307959 RepID=A0A673IBE9_9TELE
MCSVGGRSGPGLRNTDLNALLHITKDLCECVDSARTIIVMFYDAPSLTFSEHADERDIAFWRRRGQDFSPVLALEELRAERPLARWEEGPWIREPIDSGPETLHVTGERKCQSLGTEEWHPAVGLGRQLSDGEAEHWSQEQQHRLRPAKSQSLPRVLSPEDPHYGELPQTGAPNHPPIQRSSSSAPYGRYHSEWPAGERWSGQTQSHAPSAVVPKPRFSRPVKPPSYETHQQNRGSWETLSSEPVPESYRTDLFYHELTGMEPPGYIPPPSYRRFLPPRSGQNYRADPALVRWKREPVSAEMGQWFSRTSGLSWSERREDRSMAVVPRRPVHPGPVVPSRPGLVQYVPFEDPRIRHVSGGPCRNLLTDADKIRHVNKELPCAATLGQSTHDSAFLPSQGPNSSTDQIKSEKINDKSGKADKSMDKGSSESVSTVKTEPVQEPEKKSVKKKLSETIFCLVSVQLSENSNTLSSLPNQSLKSTSTTSTDLELQALTLGSGSSSIATRRAHRRRNSRSRIIKPNPHDELRRYSGAWPGDQYRDQETQTSPEPTKSNANPGPTNTEAQDAPAAPEVTAPAETTSVAPGATGASSAPPAPSVPSVPPIPAATPASGAPDPSTPYGYPMKGQKSLKPSSNSALEAQDAPAPPAQSPPSDPTEEAKSATGPNPEGFGQLLLKPVSRRPWDAIEDLETINKEAQDQAGKRPSVDQCIEDLNEAYKDILELSTASNNLPNHSSMLIPDRIKSRLSSDPLGIPATALRPSLVPGSDPEYREVKSAFSRPSTGKSVSFSKQLREEICPAPPPPEPGFRDYKTVMSQITQRKACRSVKLDIPAPKETQRDDDLTAQTSSTSSMAAEVPWADRQPMQDASTLTSPPDYEHICQTLQMARESGAVSRASIKSKPGSAMSIETPQHAPIPGRPPVDSEQPCCSSALEGRQEPMSLFREERSSGFRRVTSHTNRFLSNRGVLCSLATGNPVGDKAGLEANPEVPADWQMQLSLAEKHIATLITGEGSEENLDESNKVKGDKDIPGSESVENEVSNILATEMKDDSANAEQKPSEVKETETEQTETPESQQPEVTEKVKEEETSREKMETEQEKCEQKDPVTEGTEQNSDINSEEKKEPNVILRANKTAIWTQSGLDSELRPEFPPDHLPLSVLPYPNRRSSLGLDWERGGWEGESLGQGGFWSRERRSLDAERWGIGGETWGLDNDRQEGGGEKRGLGGWRGCGIDGQGTDDSDWELEKNTQDTGNKEADSDTKQKTLKPEQGIGEDHSSPVSSTDKVEKDQIQAVASQDIDNGRSQGPGEGQVSSVDRRSRGLSQRIEALFTAPPGHGSEERLARMREVDTVSRMRRLSLRSSDSWDGLHGVGRWGEYGWEEECPIPGPQDSSNITKVEDKEGSAHPAVTSEPKETKDDQATLKGEKLLQQLLYSLWVAFDSRIRW